MNDYINTYLYFFSSVFQGYAALTTLLTMFYFYLFERNNAKKQNIEKRLFILLKSKFGVTDMMLTEIPINAFAVLMNAKKSKNIPAIDISELEFYVKKNEEIYNLDSNFKDTLLRILYTSILILMISLVSLALVNIGEWFNRYLIVSVAVLIILTFFYFWILIKTITAILKLKVL